MTIQAAIADLQRKILSLPGIKSAPEIPPEAAGVYPFGVSYERSGVMDMPLLELNDDIATLFCEIHVSRVLLPKAIETAMAFRNPFMRMVMEDPTLGDTVSDVMVIRRTFGRLEWGGLETIGYRFELDVKSFFEDVT